MLWLKWTEPLLLLLEGLDETGLAGLGLPCLNNFFWFWDVGAVFSCLVPGLA